MTSLVRTTGPTVRPLTVADILPHLKIETDEDDSNLLGMLDAAIAEIDGKNGWLGRAIIQQTWQYSLDSFCKRAIRLPLPPLVSVTSIKYYDTDGTLQTLSSSAYRVLTAPEPGIVEPIYGTEWPATRDMIDAVQILYVCGYTQGAVPPQIITYLKNRVGTFDGSRDTLAPISASEASWMKNMLEGLRVRANYP